MPDLVVHVSKRIREEFENGRDYYVHHGKSLRVLPDNPLEKPDPAFLRWHNDFVYERGGFDSPTT